MSNLSRKKTPHRPLPLKHTSGPKELPEVTRKDWGMDSMSKKIQELGNQREP